MALIEILRLPQKMIDFAAKFERLEKEYWQLRNSLHPVRFELGKLQKQGKRPMRQSDLKDGLIAWREIDHFLYQERIEPNNGILCGYDWCYAVGGPWGHLRVDISKQKWWVEDKKKQKKK